MGVSVEAAADFVSSALGDSPEVPLRYCAQCLFGAMHIVYPKETVEAASDFTRPADRGVAAVSLKPAVRTQMLQRKTLSRILDRPYPVPRDDPQEIDFLFDLIGFKCFTTTPRTPHIANEVPLRCPNALPPNSKTALTHFVAICIQQAGLHVSQNILIGFVSQPNSASTLHLWGGVLESATTLAPEIIRCSRRKRRRLN
ncbi:hypothetical protein B0H19DRAFT_1228505 [Mycena capillaripes]|nr:hypothetical protein B0H19DRAFT_1228505 [Mycena capillaripes]